MLAVESLDMVTGLKMIAGSPDPFDPQDGHDLVPQARFELTATVGGEAERRTES